MQAERSGLLTENVADFAHHAQSLAAAGDDHWGFVFSSPRSMPRGTDTIGVFVEALDGFLAHRPSEDDCRNEVAWLQPPN
jgi:hypothetical protein